MKIPQFKQINKLACGPAVLSMVFAYYEKNYSQQEIIKEIGGLKKYGSRMIKLAKFAENTGFKTKLLSYDKKLKNEAIIKLPNLIDINKLIGKKVPVILAVRSSLLYNEKLSTKEGHYIVVTEYKNGIYSYNDPFDGKKRKIKEADLFFAWFNNILDSSAYLLAISR